VPTIVNGSALCVRLTCIASCVEWLTLFMAMLVIASDACSSAPPASVYVPIRFVTVR
jgi:hypothetical protein